MSKPAFPRLILAPAKIGRGVFAAEEIQANMLVLRFGGEILHLPTEFPPEYKSIEDHCQQIGPDLFLGPSGEMDDYVNHSCDPNCGLFEIEEENTKHLILKSLRTILQGEEITWDYSTWMWKDEWNCPCACGTPSCRKLIADFESLPVASLNRYMALGCIPSYISQSLHKK